MEVPTIPTPHPPAPFEGSELNPTGIEALARLLVGTGLCLSDVKPNQNVAHGSTRKGPGRPKPMFRVDVVYAMYWVPKTHNYIHPSIHLPIQVEYFVFVFVFGRDGNRHGETMTDRTGREPLAFTPKPHSYFYPKILINSILLSFGSFV